MKYLSAVIILVILLGGGYFLAKNLTKTPQPSSTNLNASPSVSDLSPSPNATSSPSAMQEIKVEGSEFSFSPSTISVKKGDRVKIDFKNMGKYPHNFTITELGVASSTIQPGQETTLTFTASKTGSFVYECSVPGHADRGMKGTLTVN
ncbi:MAG TPA: cupredoxin domain-containing protein [Patescibacteria group bacterium]